MLGGDWFSQGKRILVPNYIDETIVIDITGSNVKHSPYVLLGSALTVIGIII